MKLASKLRLPDFLIKNSTATYGKKRASWEMARNLLFVYGKLTTDHSMLKLPLMCELVRIL